MEKKEINQFSVSCLFIDKIFYSIKKNRNKFYHVITIYDKSNNNNSNKPRRKKPRITKEGSQRMKQTIENIQNIQQQNMMKKNSGS